MTKIAELQIDRQAKGLFINQYVESDYSISHLMKTTLQLKELKIQNLNGSQCSRIAAIYRKQFNPSHLSDRVLSSEIINYFVGNSNMRIPYIVVTEIEYLLRIWDFALPFNGATPEQLKIANYITY
jgi:hypothetical protein